MDVKKYAFLKIWTLSFSCSQWQMEIIIGKNRSEKNLQIFWANNAPCPHLNSNTYDLQIESLEDSNYPCALYIQVESRVLTGWKAGFHVHKKPCLFTVGLHPESD